MTARKARASTRPAMAPERPVALIACGQCGYEGPFPDDRQSPYLACGGNPARHQRTPVHQ